MVREDYQTYRITDLDKTERPRERLAAQGAQSLSQAELLAILLRTGVPGENAVQVGQRLMKEMGGLVGIHRASYEEVCDQHGIGPAKAAQIKAAIELGTRMVKEAPEERRRHALQHGSGVREPRRQDTGGEVLRDGHRIRGESAGVGGPGSAAKIARGPDGCNGVTDRLERKSCGRGRRVRPCEHWRKA